MIKNQSPKKNKRSNSRKFAQNQGSKSSNLWEEGQMKEDLSPLLKLIVDNKLMEYPMFKQIFGLKGDENQNIQLVSRFLSTFRRENPKHQNMLQSICLALNMKNIEVDSSEIGIRLLTQRPIYIDHTISTTEQNGLQNQIVKIIKMVRQGSNIQEIFNKIVPNQSFPFQTIKENLINFLVEEGRIVYIHSQGFFPSLQPACYSPEEKVIRGAFHLMEWKDNLFVVEMSKGSMKMLRKIYELQVDSLLISQVNWTKMLSSFGGEVNYFSEQRQGSILKTASLAIQKKVEAKKNFIIQQQQLQESMAMEFQSQTPARLHVQQITQSIEQLNFTPTRQQQVSTNESQQTQMIMNWICANVIKDFWSRQWALECIGDGCYGLVLGGYIVGIISGNQLVLPDYQNIETTAGHCKMCGLYPNQESHSCNGILVVRR